MLRVLLNDKPSNHTSTKIIHEKTKFLSVNQMLSQVKLLETWKATNLEAYPLKFKHVNHSNCERKTRGMINGDLSESGKTKLSQASFTGDATRTWNQAPIAIKTSKTVTIAKSKIKSYIQ